MTRKRRTTLDACEEGAADYIDGYGSQQDFLLLIQLLGEQLPLLGRLCFPIDLFLLRLALVVRVRCNLHEQGVSSSGK